MNDDPGCMSCLTIVGVIAIACWYAQEWPLGLLNRARAYYYLENRDFESAVSIQPEDVATRRKKAEYHLKFDEYDAAYAEYTAILERTDSAEAYHQRALVMARQENFQKANDDLIEAAVRSPKSAPIYLDLAIVQLAKGNTDAAARSGDRSLALDPSNWLAKFVRGYIHWRSYEDEQAIKCLSTVLANDGTATIVKSYLADCEATTGRMNAAEQHYREVQVRHAELRGVLELLEEAAPSKPTGPLGAFAPNFGPKLPPKHRKVPRWPTADGALQPNIVRFLSIVRDSFVLHVADRAGWQRINCLMRAGREEEAFRQYDDISRSKKRYLEASIAEARVWLAQNQPAQAAALLKQQLARTTGRDEATLTATREDEAQEDKDKPSAPRERKWDAQYTLGPAFALLGRALLASEDYEGALRAAEEAAKIDGDRLDLRLFRADVFARLQRYESSLEICDDALKASPDSAQAHFQRGDTLLQLARAEEAQKAFAAALAIDQSHAEANLGLARCLIRLGQPSKAVANYEAYLRNNPTSRVALVESARLLRQLGQHREAATRLQVAIAQSGDAALMVELSILRSSSPDEQARQGRQALNLAARAAEIEAFATSPPLEAMAAAHAELGEFDKAIFWQERAIETEPSGSQRDDMKARLEIFRTSQPLRVSP